MGYYRTAIVSTARGRALPRMGYRVRKPTGRGGYKVPRTGAPVRRNPRVQQRYGNTPVKTRQRKPRKIVRPKSTGDNTSHSMAYFATPWKYQISRLLYKNILGRRRKLLALNRTDISTTGQQGVMFVSHLRVQDLNLLKSDVTDGVSTNNEVRLFLGKVHQKTHFRNQANNPCKLMIYDIVCKTTPQTSTLNDPIEAWTKGNTDFGQVSAANKPLATYIPGVSPNQSPEFRHFWKIQKVTTVMMEPGQQHEHTSIRKVNRYIKSTSWEYIVSMDVLSGITGGVLYVWYGALAHETDNSAVTFTPIRMDVAQTQEISYGYIKQNEPSYVLESAAYFKDTGIVDLDMMGETGDADLNPGNA